MGAIGAASGPVIGGVLTQWAGWRWVFFICVPVGVVTVAAAMLVLPGHDRPAARTRLDVVGAIVATAGMVGVVYGVMGFR